jgi:beta-glucanase (GH16 family)
MKILSVLCMAGCVWFTSDPPKEKLKLVWSDEFSNTGAPDSTSWAYDIGTGWEGWGNHELQYYTSDTKNVSVVDGKLKITAINEEGKWTSARLKTQGKKSWKYGRIVFSAKLPTGVGTWPALWLLGDNITSKEWPTCGEIDVMEHVGRNPGVIQSAIHTRATHGDTPNKQSTSLPSFNTEFHEYQLDWSEDKLEFSVDGTLYYTYSPPERNDSTWPFNNPFFLIMNVAIGGGLGGPVDPALKSATMEVDYVRVYEITGKNKKSISQR